MFIRDILKISLSSLLDQRLRSFLTLLGIAVGIASVVLLTSIGEGVHRFTLAEFTQFGTNLIGINPGRTTTAGISGALINTVRPLTIADEEALRHLPGVTDTVSVIQGNAAVEFGKRSRRTNVLGVGPSAGRVWQINVAMGRFLPDDDSQGARAFVVLGSKVSAELFRAGSPLGGLVRIGGERYRVIGVMESKGQMLGFDLDDAVYIPTARAMSLFNLDSLMEIDVLYQSGLQSKTMAERIRKMLIMRHGSEDFTITTQDEMLKVLGSVLDILTLAVGGLGAISLLVGGVGIITIMTIAVNERTSEIGLLRAIGADRRQILLLFLGEAVVLAGLGGLAGLLSGAGIAWLLGAFVPALPTHTPWQYALYAELLAAAIGLLAGVLPASHAAGLDPIEALRAE
ncbi:ABC transporter permease [Desulfopila inferna]|uniref:ABC transporter permease n=1 Tax=Desulfopila inferna TaxID=468528 RepID=UPI0019624DA1|nr:ABC transporter permease [Desulfopila inferna]MBM9606324.1 ABC transporter permease [Desulfopila inferna]